MKTYNELTIDQKVNCKGNLSAQAKVCNAGGRFIASRIILEDLLPTRFNLLRTESEYKAHIFKGQNLFE